MTVRRVLIWEGKPTSDNGRQIVHGALSWEEPLPVVAHVGGDAHVIGRIDNIRREENGSITGEVTLDVQSLYCQADLTDAEWQEPTEEDRLLTVTSGRLRQIVLGDNPAWDKEEM